MIKKKIFLICFLLTNLIIFNGCTKLKNADKNIPESKNMEFIVKMNGGDFWNAVRMGAYTAAREYNVNLNFIAAENENDITSQINLVGEAVKKKTDALILAPSDYKALVGPTEKTYNSKIPVIIVDTPVDTTKISSFIATDNLKAGKDAGREVIREVGEKAQIGIMSYVRESGNAEQREQGLINVLSSYPDIKIAATEYCNSDLNLAYTLTKKMLSENPELKCIVALNAIASEGVAKTVEELGLKGKVKIIGFDNTAAVIEYLDKEVIQKTVIQNPFAMGYLGVRYAVMASNGEKVPEKQEMNAVVIDKNTMYLPENQKLVFPFVK